MLFTSLSQSFFDELAAETFAEHADLIAAALGDPPGPAAVNQEPPAKAPGRTTRRAVSKRRPKRGRGQARGD